MPVNESNNSGYLWFLAGAVLGASVALLYAPKSGKDTREEASEAITHSGQDLVGKGKDLYDRGRQLAEEAADLFERGRKMVQG